MSEVTASKRLAQIDSHNLLTRDRQSTLAVARIAVEEMDRQRAEMKATGGVRRNALRRLSADRWSAAEIARTLGITRQQVHKILNSETNDD